MPDDSNINPQQPLHGAGGDWIQHGPAKIPDAPLDMQKVYNLSSKSWSDPTAQEAFAQDFLNTYFGLKKGTPLDESSVAIFGHKMDAIAASNAINGIAKPVGAPDNTPEGLALRARITDSESELPNDVVTHLHMAVARHDQDSASWIIGSNPLYAKPIANLVSAYGDAYKTPLIAPGSSTDKILKAMSMGVPSITNPKVINSLAPFVAGGVKTASIDTGEMVRGLYRFLASGGGTIQSSDTAKEIEAQYQEEKNQRAARAAMAPSQYGEGHGEKFAQNVAGMAPVMAGMMLDPVLGTALGTSMANDTYNNLRDNHNLTHTQAALLSAPVALFNAIGARFIPQLGAGGEKVVNEAAQPIFDSVKKFAGTYIKNYANTEVALNLFSGVDKAAKVLANAVYPGGDESNADLGKQAIHDFLNNAAVGLVIAGPGALSEHAQSQNPNAPRPGDPYKVAVADRAREEIGLPKIQDTGAVEHSPEVMAEFVSRGKQILAEEMETRKVEAQQESNLSDFEKEKAAKEGQKAVKTTLSSVSDNAPAPVKTWESVPDKAMPDGGKVDWNTKPELRQSSPEAAKVADASGVRFDGAWEAIGKRPASWSFTDPKTGSTFAAPVGADAATVKGALDKMRVDFAEQYGVGKAQENAPSTVEGAPKAQEYAPTSYGLSPEDAKAQRDILAKKRFTDKIAELKNDLKSGKIAADLAARTKVEDIHSEITGKDFRPEGMKPRTYETVLRDTFKAGRQSKQFPLSKVAEAALDAKDKTLSSTSREARLASYRSDTTQVDNALAILDKHGADGKLAARGILDDMFGGERAKQIARNYHAEGVHDDIDQFKAIKSELEDRAKALMGANITRVYGSGRSALTQDARRKLDALSKEYEPGLDKVADEIGADKGNLSFAVEQAQRLADAKRKTSELDTALQQQGKITPAQLEARQAAVAEQQSSVEKFYQSLPIDVANKFHDNMVDIVRGSKEEIAANEQAKRDTTQVSAEKAVPEMQASTEAKFTSTKHEGFLQRINVSTGDMIKRLGGLFDKGSETRRVLADEPFQADGRAYLKERELNQTRMPQVMKDNGISQLEVSKWANDHQLRQIGDQKVLLSTGQMIDLWNQSHDPSTMTEFARGGVKAVEEAGRTGKEWTPDKSIAHGENAATDSVQHELMAFLDKTLTPAQKAYGKAMVDGYNDPELRAKTNESGMYFKNGIPIIPEDAGVWHPRTRERGVETDDELQGESVPRTGKLQDIFSSVKARQSNTHPVLAMDATTRYSQFMRRATKYAYLAPALDAASRLVESPDMKQALLDRVDTKGVSRLKDTYRAMAGINDATPKTAGQKWLEKTQTFNALWFNLSGAADVRLLSTLSAGVGIGQEHGALGMGKFLLQSVPSMIAPKEINAGPLGKIEIQPRDIADRKALADSSGFLAKRFDSRVAHTAETLPESGAADMVKGPGSGNVIKAAGNAIYNRGLKAYDTAHANTLVEVYQYCKNAGMSHEDAVRFTEQSCRDWQTPSHPMDYTKSYQGTIPMRLLNPFSGAASRYAAKGAEAVASWRQAKTPEQQTQAYKNMVYWTAGLVGLSATRSVFNNLVSGRIRNGAVTLDDKKEHILRDGAISALTMGVNPWVGRVAEGLANGVQYSEDPSSITTVGGAHQLVQGIAALVKAHASDEKIDWSDDKNKEAAKNVALGALASSRLLGAAAVRNEKFIVGGKPKEE